MRPLTDIQLDTLECGCDDIVQRYGGYKEYDHRVVLPSRWVPTPADIRECCGVWVDKEDGDVVIVEPGYHDTYYTDIAKKRWRIGLGYYASRAEFEDDHSAYERIEPIPDQCVPGISKTETAPKWTDAAVERYPRVTELD